MSSEPGLRTFLSQRVAPATSRGGPAADGQRLRLTRMSFAVAAAFSSVALGNPLNPTVVVGSATFQSTANTLTVTNTNGAVINWRGFSIGQGEITRFIQPGALSQVLNRVTGGSPSVILGALQSNGRVFLINQNGIAFGPGAQVDVGGLVVSSLGLSNADFAAGRLNFTQQAGAGGIVNQGVIRTASGGLVALVAPNVENHGVIQAPNGDVILAAGKSANLVDLQRPQIQVEVNAADNQALNVGQLVGRNIGIYAGAIRHSGIANANTAALDEQGRVVFKAVGDTLVSGKVEAGNTAGAGGRVEILGNRVGLLDGARVDASGVTGGGTVLVGGDFQGRNPEVQNAQRTYVAPTATVSADALHNGDGGKVVVWADGTTRAYGSLSAHAGTQGGDGGLIETSGKQFLDVEGARIDARAAHGAQGTWLLDPTDITVVAAGANAAYADVDAFADPDVGGAGASRVSPTTLDGAGANVVLQAQNDITVTDAISLTTTPNANLTLQAGRSIAINNSVATNGSGNITMVANNTDISETNAAGGALVGSGGTNRSTGAASLTVSGAISTGAGGAIKLVNSSASTLGGETGGVTVNSAITTGSSTASGVASGAITIAAGTTITLNPGGSLTTGNATVASTAGVDTAASGAINLTAVTGISGAGTATTGSATVDNAAGGADSAVSGGITLNVSGAGAINLVTAAALAAGGASVSNNTGGTSATTGNLTLSASSINATVAIPEASGATTNTQGVVNATATGAGGGITLSSAGPLRVGVLNTVDGDTAAVAVTVTGDNLLEIASASNLDQDSVTLTADKIKVGAGVTAASAVVKPTGAQTIDLGAAADTGFALDSTELGNFTVTHLEVGSAAAGAITLSADVTPANTGNLHLRTSGGVDGATGGILGDKNVAITAGGTVNLASATNDIDQLAVSNAGNAVTVVDANGLAVGDVSIIGGTLSGVTGSTVSLTAANGTLTIGNTAAASGKDIDASGAVTLTTSTSGNVILTGTTTADANTVQINSAGAINGSGLVTAATVDLNAVSGVGSGTALSLAATTITADNSGNGNLDLNNALAGPVTATTLTTGTGSIAFDQTGGGALTVATATTGDGAVTLTNTGNDLTVGGSVSGIGGVTLDAGAGTLVLNGNVNNGGPGSVAPIVFRADGMTLAGGSVTANDAPITLTSGNAAQPISLILGGGLHLDQAELDVLSTTGGLTIGDSGHMGDITVGGTVTTPAGATGGFTINNGYDGVAGGTAGRILDSGAGLIDVADAVTLKGYGNIGDPGPAVAPVYVGAATSLSTFSETGNVYVGKNGPLVLAGVSVDNPAGAAFFTATGSITQSAPIAVDSFHATVTGAGGITLLDSLNTVNVLYLETPGAITYHQDTTYTVAQAAGNGMAFSTAADLNLAAVITGGGGPLNIDAGTGDVDLTTTGAITISGPGKVFGRNLSFNFANAVNFTGGDNSIPGYAGVSNDLSIKATGNVMINASSMNISGGTTIAGAGQNLTNDTVIQAAGLLSINTTGDFMLNGGTARPNAPTAVAQANAFLSAGTLDLHVGGNFYITGGTANLAGGEANASAIVLVNAGKAVDVTKNFVLTGGTITGTGTRATALAVFDPELPLNIKTGGSVAVIAGTAPSSSTNFLASAGILNAGPINFTIGGSGSFTHPDPVIAGLLGPGIKSGLIIAGSRGSGLFDVFDNPITNNDYPISYKFTGGGRFTVITDFSSHADAFVKSRAPIGVDESLLGYLYYSINTETIAKSRRGETDQGNFKRRTAGQCK